MDESKRKLDVFTHVMPERFFELMMRVAPNHKDMGKRVREIPMLVDLETRLRVMDRFEGYQQILSLASPPIEHYAAGRDAVELARAANDGMAALVDRHADRFPGFVASLPMDEPDAAVAEADRALGALGALGVQIFTNVRGKPLDAPEFLPLFQLMVDRDRPVWLHPARAAGFPDYQTEDRSRYEIWWTFGWPYETSAAMARMVFSGFFDRWPSLKIIVHHMGAMVPFFEGRVGPGWDQLGARTSDEDYGQLLARLRKRPIDYFRMFYVDTALFGAYAATECGLAFYGTARVMFASDSPFDPEQGTMYIRETIGVIDRLPLTDAQRADIYWRNAVRLLGLPGG